MSRPFRAQVSTVALEPRALPADLSAAPSGRKAKPPVSLLYFLFLDHHNRENAPFQGPPPGSGGKGRY